MTVLGIDYSFDRPTSPAAIRAAGYAFVCRYVGGSQSKDMTASEARALIAAGLTIVTNWEAATGAALNGYSQGASDAKAAQAQATAAGMPATRPIYFSFDEDPRSLSAAQWTAVEGYYQGVASVLGVARTGAYGGYALVQRLLNNGLIRWAWQTYAWSNGAWDSRAQLRQIQNGITVAGADSDKDQAMTTDFGQWPITTEDDMEQTEKLIGATDNPNRTVGQLLADLANERNYLYSAPGSAKYTAPAGSVLDLLAKLAQAGPAAVELTDAQLQTVADKVTASLNDKLDTVLARLDASDDALNRMS